MIAMDFWQVVVRPTVHEFYKEPGDIRLKTLAVLTLQAMNEHYYFDNEQFPERIYDSTDVGKFKKHLRAAHPFLGTIMDHANAAKHVKERKGLPSFENTNVRRKINVCGVMRCGWPLDSRPYLLDSPELNFLMVDVVKCAEEFWAGRLGDPQTNVLQQHNGNPSIT